MNHKLPEMQLSELRPTRDYLQDVAKVLGKVQQLFLPAEAHYWHVGLELTATGFATQKFIVNGHPSRLSVNLLSGTITSPEESWLLGDVTAEQLLHDLNMWLAAEGAATLQDQPALSGAVAHCDQEQAQHLYELFAFAVRCLRHKRRYLKQGVTSPILLYPHHFDLALGWYPRDKLLYTMGCSSGDQTIAEPYFYLTAYPEAAAFRQQALPTGVRWQTAGFSGAVLTYDTARRSADADQVVEDLFGLAKNLSSGDELVLGII